MGAPQNETASSVLRSAALHPGISWSGRVRWRFRRVQRLCTECPPGAALGPNAYISTPGAVLACSCACDTCGHQLRGDEQFAWYYPEGSVRDFLGTAHAKAQGPLEDYMPRC